MTPIARLIPEEDQRTVNILTLMGALWRGRRIMALSLIATLGLGGAYTFYLAPPRYAATAALSLESDGQKIMDIESLVGGGSTEDDAMNTEVELIRSRDMLTKLVEAMDLTRDPEFNEHLRPAGLLDLDALLARAGIQRAAARIPQDELELNDTVEAVRGAIAASIQRNTYVMTLTALSEDELKARAIANTLAELYVQDQIDQKFLATETAITWLTERAAELEIEMRQQEQTLGEFRTRTDIVSLDAIEALNRQLADARNRLSATRAERAAGEDSLLRAQGLMAAGDLRGLAALHEDDQLNRLVRAGDTEGARARTVALSDRAQAVLSRQDGQVRTLAQSVERLEAQIAGQSQDLAELQQFEREIEATQMLYKTFLARLKEATVQRGLQQPDARIMSRAIPGNQIAPRHPVNLILAAMLGLLIGAAAVLSRQFLNKGYRTGDALEGGTGLPLLGQIPKMPFRRRDQLLTYLNDKPASPAAEAIRNLRTSILLQGRTPPQIIMSTSSLPGEGKTTQSISLAHNFAGLGKKVILIEGDVRRRTLDSYFKARAGKEGLVTAMKRRGGDISDLVVRDPRLKADILLGEECRINAADLFSSSSFRDFLESLRDRYDVIIVDTPPVLVVPDARVIGQHVDAILFNVAWDRTARTQVREALRQLETVNLKVNGLVLGQVDPSGAKRYGYGGTYGSYGRGYYEA
ncbi:GumC family protein [Palleronia sp.]|uniref:GumC family protein n=1 Tax=Palleronia sp. TaxID=1940284 RepID=UPI0035C7CCF2